MTTIVFPDHFEVRSAKGNLLKMTRLYRFRTSDGQDYVAAMETKRAPFLNSPEWIDVFKIDPITGSPLWVPLDCEEVCALALSRYDNYQSAGFFINEHRKYLCKKYIAKQILPYLEELEIKLLGNENARTIARSLLCNQGEKHRILRQLHKAMCSADKGADMAAAADTLIFTLWSDIDGQETGKQLLREAEAGAKRILINALYELMLLDVGDNFHLRIGVRDYILRNYWEKPYRLDQIRIAFEDYFSKSLIIHELLDRYDIVGDSCNVKKEDIQALCLDPDWKTKWYAYRQRLFEQT